MNRRNKWARVYDSDYSMEDVERLAHAAGITLCYRRSRCMHGYTRGGGDCVECENGYVTDGSSYALLPDGVVYYAETDDGMDVAYIPTRYNSRVERSMTARCFLCEQPLTVSPTLGYSVYSLAKTNTLTRPVCTTCEKALGNAVFDLVVERQHFWDLRNDGHPLS